MSEKIIVAKAAGIPSGTIRTFFIAKKKIAVANVDGEFFAIDDACSHKQCSLGTEGSILGNIVSCGCHGATFDVKDGKALTLPAVTDVASYDVTIENGEVYIHI